MPEVLVAGILLAALWLYALTGGADFGGGVWDLLARGPRANDQRALIAQAIGPIWEANHVWLILVVVLLFVAFPAVFAAIAIDLHIPLVLLLLGIVLRGSAFVFRAYGLASDDEQRRWSRIFAIASAIAPVMLGVVLGATISGSIRIDPDTGSVVPSFLDPWLAPFPFAVGALVLALFAFLAAVYLTLEATTPDLREDFRDRALASGIAVCVAAWVALASAHSGAPRLYEGLARSPWMLPFQLAVALVALATFTALWLRRFALARVFALLQVSLVVAGLGLAEYPYLLPPDLTITRAAAPRVLFAPLLAALAGGAIVLLPSLFWLFKVFKGRGHA